MKNTKQITTISMFAGLVVVLQVVATFINFGGFPITLTLIPIIIAGALYGPKIGALMGTVFGVVVALMVITGTDPSGAGMLAMRPVVTILACVLKGTFCGLAGALVYKVLNKKNKVIAIVLASAVTPIVNTGILYTVIIIFFSGTFAAMLGAFMSVNFAIELITNILLAPGLLRIVDSKTK